MLRSFHNFQMRFSPDASLKLLFKIRLKQETNLMQACSANQHQEIMPSWLPKVHSRLRRNALCLIQSAFSNFALHVINNATISGQFAFVIEENLGRGNHVIFVTVSFSKTSPSTRVKTRSRCFNLNSSGLKSVLEKLPISWRISDSRPNRSDKAAFSNFIGMVWTSSESHWNETFSFLSPFTW